MAALAKVLAREAKLPGYKPPSYTSSKKKANKNPPRKRYTAGQKSNPRAAVQSMTPQISQDYRRTSARYGKKKPVAVTARKLTRTQLNKTVYSVRNYGAWNRGLGAIDIRSNRPVVGAPVECPVHLWEVTGAVQSSATPTLRDYPSTFYRLEFDDTGSSHTANFVTFSGGSLVNVNGFDTHSTAEQKDYTLFPTWSDQRKYADTSNNVNLTTGPGAKSYLESFKAKFVLNGPTQKATKWCIQLVQLSETVTPGWANSNDNVATAFWEAISKPYGFSPLDPGPASHLKKYIKVLKSMYVNMDAPESTEDHVSARMRQIDFTGFLNRTCNYAWGHKTDKTNLSTDDIPENANTGNHQEFSTHVHPNARVYIMVRALCTFRDLEIPSNAVYPSYDILLQTTHRSLD